MNGRALSLSAPPMESPDFGRLTPGRQFTMIGARMTDRLREEASPL
jgi:hypothetical protein